MDFVEICDKQTEIIKTQSDIIDSLFRRLAQILSAKELDSMPELEQMQRVVDTMGGISHGRIY
ncbi:MAG: hypothetical protein LUD72_01950 [Bacteroidales bacterium]|nr:hypothetical protein [Bacteroidales bacterium]